MLAAAARRAGFRPFVVDSFGDTDARGLSEAFEVIPDAYERGFRASTLLPALERLASLAGSGPAGVVLGAGFEDAPKLVAEIARRWPVLGCGADAVANAKSPAVLYGLLRDLGIPHPETQVAPPASGAGWVTRRVGGSGGTHIALCRPHVEAHADRFFQRRIAGQPVSLSGVVSRRGYGLGFTSQWVSPMPRRPFRFGGLAGPVTLDADAEARMIDVCVALVPRLQLVGLVSFDFLLVDGEPHLLEVNPRPGLSLDVLDDANGCLFRAHVEACRDPSSRTPLPLAPPPEGARAVAYLYADDGPVTVPRLVWPDWTSDRPADGALIPRHAPLATVHAAAATADAARELVLNRLQGLARLLDEGRSGKGTIK